MRPKALFSLKAKLFGAFFFLAVFITLVISYVLFVHMRTNHLDTLKRDMVTVAGVAASQLERGPWPIVADGGKDSKDLTEFLRNIHAQSSDISLIYVIRPDYGSGRYMFLADSLGSETGSRFTDEYTALLQRIGLGKGPDWGPGIAVWGESVTAYAPVRDPASNLVAVVGVAVDAGQVAKDVRHFAVQVLSVTAGAVLVVAAVSVLLARKFTKRLSRLDKALDRIASGESDIGLTVDGQDEVALLAARINQLAATLSSEREDLLLSAIESLVTALEAKDAYTYGHSSQVSVMADAVAERLKVGQQERFRIKIAALLHDIGKIGVPDKVLNKTDKLDDDERKIIQEHPVIGAKILAGIPALVKVTEIVKHHHARWDGAGYPEALAGEDIPLGARIIAVADTFQAMTSDRPYRKGMDHEVAMAEIRRCAGSQFDPAIVAVFGEVYRDFC